MPSDDFTCYLPFLTQSYQKAINCTTSEWIEVGLKSIAIHSFSITLNWAIDYLYLGCSVSE